MSSPVILRRRSRRRIPRKSFGILLIFALFLFVAAPLSLAVENAPTYHLVTEVISGDSFRLESGSVIRYASVHAPSILSPKREVELYAQESLAFNRQLIEGNRVRLEWGSRIRDQEGNYVAFVYLEDGTFANKEVLDKGFAKLRIIPPNLEHQEELQAVAKKSRQLAQGIWRFEADKPRIDVEFIGDKMTKLFHQPDCERLDDVLPAHRIDFKSRVDAVSKGYKYDAVCKKQHTQDTDLY